MAKSSPGRLGMLAFLSILTVSAGTMLWLFWHFPLTTALITGSMLAALVVLARLARSIEVDLKDSDRTEQSA